MMPLTGDDAVYVTNVILNDIINLLPQGFLVRFLALQNPREIFQILQPAEFSIAFHKNVSFFNRVLNCNIDVGGVDAFVSPEPDQNARRIYVKIGGDETHGVLIHEFFHWLSHPDFYPNFYEQGGTAPDIVEGVTEYFTRLHFPKRTFYNDYYVAIRKIAHLQKDMYKAVFKGDVASIKQIAANYAP